MHLRVNRRQEMEFGERATARDLHHYRGHHGFPCRHPPLSALMQRGRFFTTKNGFHARSKNPANTVLQVNIMLTCLTAFISSPNNRLN